MPALRHEPIDWTGPDLTNDKETAVSTTPTDYKPTVPPKVRDWAYFIGLAVGALTTLALGVVPIWAPDYTEQIKDTVSAVNGAALLVIGGLGVVYRPGKTA